jgi:hypothetical protein
LADGHGVIYPSLIMIMANIATRPKAVRVPDEVEVEAEADVEVEPVAEMVVAVEAVASREVQGRALQPFASTVG